MKRLLVVLVAFLLVVSLAAPAVSAQEPRKDLQVEIQAPGVRYPGEWFDITIKVTNSSWVDTYFSAIVWLEKPAWGGEYKLLQVGSNTGVGERCDSSRCVFAWSGSIGWEQYKLLTVHVQAGSEIGKHRLVRVGLTQYQPLFPSRIDKEAYLTIASPPEEPSKSTTPPKPTPLPSVEKKVEKKLWRPVIAGRTYNWGDQLKLVFFGEFLDPMGTDTRSLYVSFEKDDPERPGQLIGIGALFLVNPDGSVNQSVYWTANLVAVRLPEQFTGLDVVYIRVGVNNMLSNQVRILLNKDRRLVI